MNRRCSTNGGATRSSPCPKCDAPGIREPVFHWCMRDSPHRRLPLPSEERKLKGNRNWRPCVWDLCRGRSWNRPDYVFRAHRWHTSGIKLKYRHASVQLS